MGPIILAFLTTVLPGLVWVVLRALGFALITFVGLDLVLSEISAFITSSFSGVDAGVVGVLGLMKVDIGVQIILSSWAAAFSIKQTLGGVKRLMAQ